MKRQGVGARAARYRAAGARAFHRGRALLAARLLAQAVSLEPARPATLVNLGESLRRAGRPGEARRWLQAALSLSPMLPEAHANLGLAWMDLGHLGEAEKSARRATALKPDDPMGFNGLGMVLASAGKMEGAEAAFRHALSLAPDSVAALNNLGMLLQDFGLHGEAEACFRRVLALDPASADAWNNLGTVLQDRGRLDEALECYARALARKPDFVAAFSNRLLALNYAPGIAAEALYAAHRDFNARFAPRLPALQSYANRADPDRPLHIGYVSGDLRTHPVATFLEPVLAHRDKERFKVHLYATRPGGDAVTGRLRASADAWGELFGLDDDAAAARIRQDGIDILVDLSGHTAHHRLLVFARKPAPVQAAWLGYLNTTGLEAMDFRITDGRASPRGLFDALHSERLVRLPGCQWCYQPPEAAPDVAPPPSMTAGHVTFGAFANLAKITAPVVELWSRVLKRIPDARLIVAGRGLRPGDEEFLRRFAGHGIAAERLELLPYLSFPDYLAAHARVDVMLDTFPYTGGTTSCHALWMGVPLITMTGTTPPSRGGASLLGAVRLPGFVAASAQDYVELAAEVAANPRKLATLRAGLRKRMLASPLMDAARFTQHLEAAYRAMWSAWCRRK